MKKRFCKNRLALGLATVAVALASCMNNDYDLSDIDSTVGINVNDLTIPLNLDRITLDAMLDLDENSQIKKMDNGEYAIVESGTYRSNTIQVPSFTAAAPSITPIEAQLTLKDFAQAASRRYRAGQSTDTRLAAYDISNKSTEINVQADNVSEYIVDLDDITATGLQARLQLLFDGLQGIAKEIKIEDLTIDFIPGLQATPSIGTYDAATGKINIGNVSTTTHRLDIALNVEKAGRASGIRLENHVFSLSSACHVASGSINIYESDVLPAYRDNNGNLNLEAFKNAVPQNVHYVCAPTMTDINVEKFSGDIKYDIDGISIDPVELNDIPDALNQEGTDIRMANPQLYLEASNPLYGYGLKAQANLKLTSHTAGKSSSYTLDNPEGVVIDKADNKYCLSPYKPGNYYVGTIESNGEKITADFTNAMQQGFTQLSNVLSGEKIPESIDIDVVDPRIPQQKVTDFQLGKDIAPVEGKWVFYAPLQLTPESKIKYSETIDGWNDEDLDALTIKKINVLADCSTDLPISATFTVYPIDTEGRRICDENGNSIVGTIDKTITKDMSEPIVIAIEGNIRHLDGIIIEARLDNADGQTPLKPTQTIALENIKVKVSGTYEKEL